MAKLGWIHRLHWVPAGEHLLAVTWGHSPELAAVSWPGREVLWRRPLPHANAIYSWDFHGSVLVLDVHGAQILRFDHASGEPVDPVPLPEGMPSEEYATVAELSGSAFGVLSGEHYFELNSSLSLTRKIDLQRIYPTISFMPRTVVKPNSASKIRALVYQAGIVLLDVDTPADAVVVNTSTPRTFGQIPFDSVPNPINPLSKFVPVDPGHPESLGTVSLPTFTIGAAVWREPNVFLFGGPFSRLILVLNFETMFVRLFHGDFAAHNHRPTIAVLDHDNGFIIEGSGGCAEFRIVQSGVDGSVESLRYRAIALPTPGSFAYCEARSVAIVLHGSALSRKWTSIPLKTPFVDAIPIGAQLVELKPSRISL